MPTANLHPRQSFETRYSCKVICKAYYAVLSYYLSELRKSLNIDGACQLSKFRNFSLCKGSACCPSSFRSSADPMSARWTASAPSPALPCAPAALDGAGSVGGRSALLIGYLGAWCGDDAGDGAHRRALGEAGCEQVLEEQPGTINLLDWVRDGAR